MNLIEKIFEEKFYDSDVEDVLRYLETNRNGLTEAEYKKRLEVYGLNELKKSEEVSKLKIFFRQFLSPFITILLVAALVCFLLKEYNDAWVILGVVILNSIVGSIQEYKAEKIAETLKKMVPSSAKVIRDNTEVEIPSKELVPGDIIILKAGDKVPADCRLIEELIDIKVDESLLTGESVPVEKDISVLQGNIPIAERKNMLFSGTMLTYGKCIAVVASTGTRTEIGNIQNLAQTTETPDTPLHNRMTDLSKIIGLAVISVSIILFSLGILFNLPSYEIFRIVSAQAVSSIPEGLPVVITILLAVSMYRMAKKNALIRRLPVAEVLGTTTIICTDKTGTLTENEMTIRKIYTNDQIVDVTGIGYEPEGNFFINGKEINPIKNPHLEFLLKIGILCNDTILKEEVNGLKVSGDPVEGALIVSAMKAKLDQYSLKEQYMKIGEIPFTHERKIMTTIHKTKEGNFAFVKGAPELLLKKCTKIYRDNHVSKLTKEEKDKVLEVSQKFTSESLRVLLVCYRKISNKVVKFSTENVENDLILVGLVGALDPPRKEAKDAIKVCEDAGIKIVMITGDHKLTATTIGKELGLLKKDSLVITGEELESMNPEEFEKIIGKIAIYARVSPEHKLRIIEMLRKKGHVVAMTGDGVNDAPALKAANIGISMGSGSDVAREASGMILTDDNFVSITHAVEEGRIIYNNIKKVVMYLVSTSMGEVLNIFTSIIMGLPLPLTPIQILWVNMITDGPSDVALSMESKEGDEMKKKPHNSKEKIITKNMFYYMLFMAMIMTIGTMGLFIFELRNGSSINRARTIAYTTCAIFQLFNVLNCRSTTKSLFKIDLFSNKYILAGIVGSLIAQIMVIYIPFFQQIFGSVPLILSDWIKILLVSSTIFISVEALKHIRNRNVNHQMS